MEHKERIELYISGQADKKTLRRTEKALLRDERLWTGFMEAVEQRLYTAPSSLVGTVMGLLPSNPAASVTVPVLSRKMCAAVCFCSAAAIMLFTIPGLDRQIYDLISAQSDKIREWIAIAQSLTTGG